MRRACKITLQYSTQKKHRAIQALLEAYRGAVNFFIRSLWQTPGSLDKITLARLPDANTRLSNRYKAQALRQALGIVIATKKSARELGVPAGCPVFRGSAILDAKFIDIEIGKKSFDLVIRLSTLKRGKRITLPTRRTAMLNKWLNKPGSKLIQGGALSDNQIILWIEAPDEPPKTEGVALGVDVGMCKLLATSNGEFYGTEFRAMRDKVKRCRSGSNGKRRARIERDQYINRVVKQLPWSQINVIAYEDLTDMKRGKGTRSKNFRKAAAPWSYRQVRQRIESLAQENRVLPVAVDPRGTSRTCPICNTADRRNRKGENFRCISCDYSADADYVGSLNILTAALGRVESPRHQCH
jgi:IS605 OrfB family transposase